MPETMKHIFIVNPHAGKESCEETVREALNRLQEPIDYTIYVKQHRGDSFEVVSRFRADFPEEPLRFYACGGDGTLREVAASTVGVENTTFTAFAQGSGNDYVKYYGGKENFQDVERLVLGTAVPIDIMRINGESYALNATHFGLDSSVAKTMDHIRRIPLIGGPLAYPCGVAWALLTAMKTRCTVWADGERLNENHILLCTAANGTHVGGSYRCAPRSINNDGLMEVCLVRPVSRLTFVSLMGKYQRGEHLDDHRFDKYIRYKRAHTLTIEAPDGFCVSLDGELYFSSHIEVENLHQVAHFVVPSKEGI